MYEWEPFYEELAEVVVGFRDRQSDLIRLLGAIRDRGLPMIKLSDIGPDGPHPLTEIDPFTFFASFNRSITDAKRIQIIGAIREALNVGAPAPSTFEGIPVLNNQKSWYFGYHRGRDPRHIPTLWDLAEAVVKQLPDGDVGPSFDHCLDTKGIGLGMLTIGLFVLRPKQYLPCDRRTRHHLDTHGIGVAVTSYDAYRDLLTEVRGKLGSDFSAISHDAYEATRTTDPPPPPDDAPEPDPPPTPVVKPRSHPLNLILHGPPGTGKTYGTVERALEICGVPLPPSRRERVAAFRKLQDTGRVAMVSFHQSYSYEEFVEGIHPELDAETGHLTYACRDGVFKRIAALAGTRPRVEGRGYQFDESAVTFWKMSLGNTLDESGAQIYEYCLEHGCLLLNYGEGLDFTGCDTRRAVHERLREVRPDIHHADYHLTSVNLLKNEMSAGDIVIISDGNHKFRAIARVTGAYRYSEGTEFNQLRPVEWLAVYEESLPRERLFRKAISQMTLYRVKGSVLKLDALREMLSPGPSSEPLNHVLIVDEINRGNIAKILGELITLLEPDKRTGQENEAAVTLPYSGDSFGVPANLYVIGTMNTADRSIALIDVALRRRFAFEELMPDPSVLRRLPESGVVGEVDLAMLLETLNRRITFLYDRDHQLGHAYLMGVTSLLDLRDVFLAKIIPLLQEYFYEDWEKVSIVLGCPCNPETGAPELPNDYPILRAVLLVEQEVLGFDHVEHDDKVQWDIHPEFATTHDTACLHRFFAGVTGAPRREQGP